MSASASGREEGREIAAGRVSPQEGTRSGTASGARVGDWWNWKRDLLRGFLVAGLTLFVGQFVARGVTDTLEAAAVVAGAADFVVGGCFAAYRRRAAK